MEPALVPLKTVRGIRPPLPMAQKNTSVMPSVAIVDVDHFFIAAAFVRVLAPITREIILVATENILREAKTTLCDQYPILKLQRLNNANDSEVLLLAKILEENEVDVCILSTIDRHFGAWKVFIESFKGKKALVVHNANFWFQKRRHLKVFRVPRGEHHKVMLAMLQAVDGLIVLSSEIKDYIHKQYGMGRKLVVFVPCVAQAFPEPFPRDVSLRLVVPGLIEAKRKDFHLILRCVQRMKVDEIALDLVGSPVGEYGRLIVEECAKLKRAGYQVTWYENYVPESEFDQKMLSASALLAPITVDTSFGGISETYGLSKATGVVTDLIRYGLPGIVPTDLACPPQLTSSLLRFSSEDDLTQILRRLTSPELRQDLKREARNNSRYWAPEAAACRLAADLREKNIFPTE